ncbi:hypothetical protein EIP91_001155 [Steccherinum ochraceum]|uniref:Peptidase A1 domain-containing protein n=1 Tax=Steccherinum ochraceum TaxID=92696 RepID=A0A4R0RRX2_9APHY|nr:hypothetical protein EIP91_001155 [Steccherinum ochraceum]
MLTIAFVLFALQLSATASPSPVMGGIQRIELTRRQPSIANHTAPADIQRVGQDVLGTLGKYTSAFKYFQENTGKAHDLVDGVTNNSKRAVATEPLADDGVALYTGLVLIGTSATVPNVPQRFTMGFDTGSASSFVVSASCTTTTCQAHRRYNPALSTTSRNLNKPFTLKVSDTESVGGAQYSETMSVAGLTATDQVFGVANTYPNSFSSYTTPPDGRVGMAYGAISAFKSSTSLPQTLNDQRALTTPVFAFRLGATGSELTLGGTDPTAFTGTVTYVPVTSRGFWQVNMDGVSVSIPPTTVGGTATVTKPVSRTQAILDTGSQYIIGDANNVAKLYAAIPGSTAIGNGMYSYPCASDPTVSLTFGGVSFPIDPTLFNQGTVPGNTDQCLGAVVAAPQTKPPQRFWSVGDVFLQTVYSIYDVSQNRVGFATLR